MLVTEFIDFCFKFVRLLFLDGLDVTLSDAFDFSKATVREAVAFKFDFFEGCVFIQTF